MAATSSSISPDAAESIKSLLLSQKKRTRDLFASSELGASSLFFPSAATLKINVKIADEYKSVKDLPPPQAVPKAASASKAPLVKSQPKTEEKGVKLVASTTSGVSVVDGDSVEDEEVVVEDSEISRVIQNLPSKSQKTEGTASNSLIQYQGQGGNQSNAPSKSKALALRNPYAESKPEWHAPWKLHRVIAGHLGWVHSLAVDPTNEWFASGSADRTIKIWDLASGTLKLTLTGHISTVHGLVVSDRHPYLFSAGEDKKLLNWDLECNKVIRHYHGHLSAISCVAMHPTLDLLISGGRDSSVRVWDIRTKANVFVLTGHTSAVNTVATQGTEPQIVSGSSDSTIRYWDLKAGKSAQTLTHHKKGIRSIVLHPEEYTMASASPDNIKHWKFPEGKFLKNFAGHNVVINTLAVNRDNVLFSGGDNGSMYFWDWRTGYNFQKMQTIPQSGSLDAEAGIKCSIFDQSGSRLIVGEVDKSIKIYKEDENATETSHPLDDWRNQQANVRRY